MTVEELLEEANAMWDGRKMSLPEIAVAMGVVHGDICRQARNSNEGCVVNAVELKKEFGNMIFSTIRWCQDMGFDPNECIEAAKAAQREYTKNM